MLNIQTLLQTGPSAEYTSMTPQTGPSACIFSTWPCLESCLYIQHLALFGVMFVYSTLGPWHIDADTKLFSVYLVILVPGHIDDYLVILVPGHIDSDTKLFTLSSLYQGTLMFTLSSLYQGA